MIDFANLPAKDKIFYQDDSVVIYCADCRDILPLFPDKSFDLVLTDPPYPDYYTEEYKYDVARIKLLTDIACRQFVFWSAKSDFPLDYTAIHIWDKKVGTASEYERIFERNGNKNYKVFSYYLINSTVAANYTGDIFYNHPSQKPLKLIEDIITLDKCAAILDPFLGSGTTAVAAKILGRKCVGIEISEKYCEIASRRCSQSVMQLDIPQPEPVKQESLL